MTFIFNDNEVIVKKLDEVYVLVSGKYKNLKLIQDQFSYYADNYMHTPAYKMGKWDGRTKFLRFVNDSQNDAIFPIGLLPEFEVFCRNYQIKIKYLNDIYGEEIDTDGIDEFIGKLGLPVKPRQYQIDYVKEAIKRKKLVVVSPTGSGKSLILYMYIRCLIDVILGKESKVLLIVPTIDLVHQMHNDFISYGYNKDDISLIHGGIEKTYTKITISTWQSLYKLPESLFKQFECLIIDEAHLSQSSNLSLISHNCSNAKFRLGTTGTVQDDLSKRQQIVANLGPIYQIVSTTQLQEEKYLSKHVIKTVLLKWKLPKGVKFNITDYQDEYKLITLCEERKHLILEIIKLLDIKTKGTILVLGRRVEYLNCLIEMANNLKLINKTYLMTGKDTSTKQRMNTLVETKSEGGIIFGTDALIGTGINIPNIDYIIIATPLKSKVRLLQSIGRGLRKTQDKTHLEIYDIVDKFPLAAEGKKNYSYNHLSSKKEIYNVEEMINQIYKLTLPIRIT